MLGNNGNSNGFGDGSDKGNCGRILNDGGNGCTSEDSDEGGRVVVMAVVVVAWVPLMCPLHLYYSLPAISITVPKVSMVMITV